MQWNITAIYCADVVKCILKAFCLLIDTMKAEIKVVKVLNHHDGKLLNI